MRTRRTFLKNIVQGNAVMWLGGPRLWNMASDHAVAGVDNPYQSVDWKRVRHVPSATHVHVPDQKALDAAYQGMKLRHIPVSNYYPSAPYYPLNTIREGQFRVHQDFGVMYNPEKTEGKSRWANGTPLEGPLDWNNIIMDPETGWYRELPEELQKQMPFTIGDLAFPDIPSDVIISPNAEHHSFTNSSLHACSPGSLFTSGSFDARNKFLTADHGYCFGTGRSWQSVFKEMLDKLLFSDGGGITVNHPVWSRLSFDEVCQMLDFDPRVLGIEVYNDTCEVSTSTPLTGWALDLWDQVLRSGRRCYGFFVPDHTMSKGRNLLLTPEFTERACLRAYRQGAFYGAIDGSGLQFTNITLKKNRLQVEVNSASAIRFVTDQDRVTRDNVRRAEFSIPVDSKERTAIRYVRVEAEGQAGERIFSQPIRFTIV